MHFVFIGIAPFFVEARKGLWRRSNVIPRQHGTHSPSRAAGRVFVHDQPPGREKGSCVCAERPLPASVNLFRMIKNGGEEIPAAGVPQPVPQAFFTSAGSVLLKKAEPLSVSRF